MTDQFEYPPLPPPPGAGPPASETPPGPVESLPVPEPRRRGRGVAFVVGIVGLLTVLMVGWLAFRPAGTPSLALSFTEGQDESFRMHMTVQGTLDGNVPDMPVGQPLDMETTMTMRWEGLNVDGDGVATIRTSVSDASGTMNGAPIPAMPATVVELRIAPDGRVLEAGGVDLSGGLQLGGGSAGMPGLGQQVTPILPDHDVRPGDTWTKEFTQEMPFGGEELSIRTENTLVRYGEVDGARAAVIETHMAMPFDWSFDSGDLGALAAQASGGGSGALPEDLEFSYGGDFTSDIKSWIDMEARQLLRSETSGDFDVTITVTGIPEADVPGGKIRLTLEGILTQEVERL